MTPLESGPTVRLPSSLPLVCVEPMMALGAIIASRPLGKQGKPLGYLVPAKLMIYARIAPLLCFILGKV